MAKEDEEEESKTEDSGGGKSNTKVIIIAVLAAVLLSGAVVGGTLYFVMGEEEEVAADGENEDGEDVAEEDVPLGPPMYQSLNPKFVVSFRDQRSARFMQFELDIMTRNKDTMMKIEEHNSAVRSSLLMLFDMQDFSIMATREGKQKLLMAVTKDINETVDRMTGETEEESAVEAAYFTSFVIQ